MCCSCAAGCGVSFVDPRYTILDDGTSNDDHPHVDIRKRDLFLYATFMAVAKGPNLGEHGVHC
jgi:phospholipase C